MRETLFRGKRQSDGEWVYGYLVKVTDYLNENLLTAIIPERTVLYPRNEIDCLEFVEEETVGQWTGLVDKNGVKIFEGDVVEYESHGYIPGTNSGIVVLKDGCYCIEYRSKFDMKMGLDYLLYHRIGSTEKWQDMGASGTITFTYEVLGNKFEDMESIALREWFKSWIKGDKKDIPGYKMKSQEEYLSEIDITRELEILGLEEDDLK